MNTNEWLRHARTISTPDYAPFVVTSMELNDGSELSVQASSIHYCTPRESGAPEYTSVEVLPISGEFPELKEFDPSVEDGPYGYVPVALVDNIIAAHGGIKQE